MKENFSLTQYSSRGEGGNRVGGHIFYVGEMVEWNGEWRGEKYCLSGNQVLPMFAKLEGVKLGLGSLCSNAAGVEALCWQRSMLLSFSCGISNAGLGPGVKQESQCIILRNTRWIIDPEVVSYLLTLREWFYSCKDHFKIHYVPDNDGTQWVRIPWVCVLPVKVSQVGTY